MNVDIHGHVSAPQSLMVYQAGLIASRGAHGRGGVHATVEQVRESHLRPLPNWSNLSHLQHLEEGGIDCQLLSPRPFTLMHSEQPPTIVRWFCEETNDIIALACEAFPDRFRGVCGLPQGAGTEPAEWVGELRRCVNDLGFVGGMLNPDPYEGTGSPPGMSDRWWYPIYEAACELDVPLLVHSASCKPPARESYTLHFITEETINVIDVVNSELLSDFPTLKLIFSHGGGAIPYQAGRFMSRASGSGERFIDRLRRVYFDTCLYTRDALELLIKTVGPDRCLFGTEKPGTGTQRDENGRWYDDVLGKLDEIEWLSKDDRDAVLSGNARAIFKLGALVPS